MKLKLLVASILILLSLVAYKQYRDFSALKSINSYESCVVVKGSTIQESYPATCITRLGARFTQPTQMPTPSTLPEPNISGWKKYFDHSTPLSSFSFEYPDFMPEPTIYWPNENTLRFISEYTWAVDYMSSGNYSHDIDMRVTGPYPETQDVELISWIKEQGWPSQEGEIQEMAGISKVIYKKISGRQSIESTFRENEIKYPRSWAFYFKTSNGIFRIDLSIQGSEEELLKYQGIFPHLLSTFKFTD